MGLMESLFFVKRDICPNLRSTICRGRNPVAWELTMHATRWSQNFRYKTNHIKSNRMEASITFRRQSETSISIDALRNSHYLKTSHGDAYENLSRFVSSNHSSKFITEVEYENGKITDYIKLLNWIRGNLSNVEKTLM